MMLSFTEKYIRLECPHDTVQIWEHEGSLDEVEAQFRGAGLLLG